MNVNKIKEKLFIFLALSLWLIMLFLPTNNNDAGIVAYGYQMFLGGINFILFPKLILEMPLALVCWSTNWVLLVQIIRTLRSKSKTLLNFWLMVVCIFINIDWLLMYSIENNSKLQFNGTLEYPGYYIWQMSFLSLGISTLYTKISHNKAIKKDV